MGLYIIIGFVREGRLEVYKIVWTPIWCEPSLRKPCIIINRIPITFLDYLGVTYI